MPEKFPDLFPEIKKPAWEIRNLSAWHKKFMGARFYVLEKINLVLPAENIQVVGPSGSGKSMLLRVLAKMAEGHTRKDSVKIGASMGYFFSHKIHFSGELSFCPDTEVRQINFMDRTDKIAAVKDTHRIVPQNKKRGRIINIQTTHSPRIKGAFDFPFTLFMDGGNVLALMPTCDLFSKDTGCEKIEEYKDKCLKVLAESRATGERMEHLATEKGRREAANRAVKEWEEWSKKRSKCV